MNKCSICNKFKTDVKYRKNPYYIEIYNDNTKNWLCNNCYKESMNDI